MMSIFEVLGKAFFVPEEQMTAVTALCSCGIAYILRYIGASVDGAVRMGYTIFAWDEVIPSGEEPELWFHDIYRSNGVPFQQEEVDCIKSQTGKR